jgi:hypothetical protein
VLVGHLYPPASNSSDFRRLLPATLASALFHALLFAALLLLPRVTQAGALLDTTTPNDSTVVETPPPESDLPREATDPFLTPDVDPASGDPTRDINNDSTRLADFTVPGLDDPTQAIGTKDGPKDRPPTNLPAPHGLGGPGEGAPLDVKDREGNSDARGVPGGRGDLRGGDLALTFYGRSAASRKKLLERDGGTSESEAAVARGLLWLKRQQATDGHWPLDGRFKDQGQNNDIAGTAFGLLPFLGAGYTHKAARNAKDNPFEKPIERGLLYLMRKQDKRTGYFGGQMYAHALATIAMCEAYGLSQDPALKIPAQRAVNFLVAAQHTAGGWRYEPNQAGDLSVSGWVIMALKSAQMAGLEVPENTMRKAIYFLDSVNDLNDEGYGYTARGSTPRLTAIGLLCREYLQYWGKNNQHMQKGVGNFLKKQPPQAGLVDMYYYYYATQVMHHLGEPGWKAWNEPMRDKLVKSQDRGPGALEGSWSPVGDPFAATGGRLMITSLSILTLEVYYRHLPLYYRDAGQKRVAAK